MRRAVRFTLSALLAVAWTAALGPSPAAAAALDSSYRFESAFLSLHPGDTGQFSVFFDNIGTSSWVSATNTQVNLAACAADKVTCNVTSDKVAWNPGSWLSATAYATQGKASVAPGDFTAFTYSVKVPAGTAAGSYRFNGDLVVASGGQRLHPQGYYQDASVIAGLPGAAAPTDLRAFSGNFDSGPIPNDVRVLFTAPAANTIRDYILQRTPGLCPITPSSSAWIDIATITATAGSEVGYTDSDVKSGNWCYQIRATDPATSLSSYSNQASISIFGPAPSGNPTSTNAVLVSDANAIGFLDSGDTFTITFSTPMIVATGATIQVTDADCGAPASQSSGPAACGAGISPTISSIRCTINANCVLSFDAMTLSVSMTAAPEQVSNGTEPGTKFPVVFTSSTGITDKTSNPWQVSFSADRVIGPQGQ